MSYQYTKAIIRKPSNSVVYGISSQNKLPNFKKFIDEHNQYLNVLKKLGLKIFSLDKLEDYPDSIFVEDPAVIYKSTCIILNPQDPRRNGEALLIKNEIKKYFNNIFFIQDGAVEGGDILNIDNHFIIGLSKRTNKLGAENLSKILNYLGATVSICNTPNNILHFKSECSLVDDNTMLVSHKMAKIDYLKKNFHLIELPSGEEGAANSLSINNRLLIPDGFKKAEEILSKNFNLIKIKIDEISKLDAGLSCMSLRW